MRVTVVSAEGVPENCMLSVRAGDQRRLLPFACEGQSLQFDNAKGGGQPLRVELLDRLATCALQSQSAGEHLFEVQSGNGQDPTIRLVLRLEDVLDVTNGIGGTATSLIGGTVHTLESQAGKHAGTGGLLGRDAKIAADAHQYLEEHKLLQAMRAGLARVLRERPAAPAGVLSQEILRLCGGQNLGNTVGNPGYTANAQPAGLHTGQHANIHQPAIVRDKTMELFDVPTPPRTTPLRMLDLGSGEVGFYSYGTETTDSSAKQIGDKLKGGFLADWVVPQKSKEFAEELIRRYESDGSLSRNGDLVFLAGATGVNREALQAKRSEREAAYAFAADVERHLAERLGNQVACRMHIFVPSGPLEAQYELSAVEWLLVQSGLEREVGLAVMESFAGTISAGGGSSQVSVKGSVRGDPPLLFSVPLGNKKPNSDNSFSTPPTDGEITKWTERVKEGLRQESFPRDMRGLFVGITATFYAAKEAKCADRVLSKAEALASLRARLVECRGPGCDPAAAARSCANLSLVMALLDWVLHAESRILFRRNWDVSGEKSAATWTLGMYAEALMSGTCGLKATR
eukprot:TRINITY_DN69474_c0_g1_i1.p1 TRINITY_DN69474_c0_g1~~TRINITY_DN69474_c0_g1_i1.p1  ORF type:complete len:572 (-),score=96.44 TRINITY_DN69474_c0_g1_i1:153-1868(-)